MRCLPSSSEATPVASTSWEPCLLAAAWALPSSQPAVADLDRRLRCSSRHLLADLAPTAAVEVAVAIGTVICSAPASASLSAN